MRGEPIPRVDAMSRLCFDHEKLEKEKIGFSQNDIFFAHTQTTKLNDIKSDLHLNQTI